MSTKGFLGGLGQGLVQMGATYGQTSLANLEADAQRMKEERLQMMQMAQFGIQSTKNVYEMEMGEKRFGLLEEEATRKEEKYQQEKSLWGKGTWEWKEIEDQGWYEPGKTLLEEGKWIKGPKRYAWVNSVTGEVKYVDGSEGAGTGTDRKMYSGPFAPWYKAYVKGAEDAGRTPKSEAEARKIAEVNGVVFDDKTKKNGTTPPPPKVDRKLVKDWDELNKMFPLPGGDMGEAWYEKQLIPDLGTKIAEGAIAAKDAITDRRVLASIYGYPVDVVTWFVNQFAPADMVIEKPAMGSKMWGEWLEALAPHYEKGKQLTKEQILKIVPALKDAVKGDLTDALDKWNKLTLGEKTSRLKEWGETILEVNEDIRASVVDKVSEGAKKAVSVITQFINEPEGIVATALESLPSKDEIIKIVEGWPTPDKVNPEDVPTIQSVIGAIKAQIEKIKTGAIKTVESWPTPDSEVAVQQENGLILEPYPTDRKMKSQYAPYPGAVHQPHNVLNSSSAMELPVETGSSIEDARRTAMATAQATDLPAAAAPVFAEDASAYIGKGTQIPALPGADIPLDKSWIEAGIGRVSEIPFDETTIVQIPTEVLIDELNDAQERIITPGITGDERQILEDNIVLIKGVLRERERSQVGAIGVEHPSAGMMEGEYPILPPGYRPPSTKNWSSGTQLPTKINYGPGGLGDIQPRAGGLIEATEPPKETDVLKMNYDQSIEHIMDIVKGLKGMNKFDVIDRLFQLNGLLQKQKGFKKTDYSKALNDVMIGLHTDSEKYN